MGSTNCFRALRALLRSAFVVGALLSFATGLRAQGKMPNYLGQNTERAARDFGDRAHFYDQALHEQPHESLAGCIVWQDPAPGAEIDGKTQAAFLVPALTLVPAIEGMSVSAASELLGYRCLSLDVVPSCGASGAAPTGAQISMMVVHQCTPANAPAQPGNHVGVVVGPYPSDTESDALMFLIAGVVIVIALATALLFYLRYASTRDELAIFKSPRGRPPPS